jgi:hypothetical protein
MAMGTHLVGFANSIWQAASRMNMRTAASSVGPSIGLSTLSATGSLPPPGRSSVPAKTRLKPPLPSGLRIRSCWGSKGAARASGGPAGWPMALPGVCGAYTGLMGVRRVKEARCGGK